MAEVFRHLEAFFQQEREFDGKIFLNALSSMKPLELGRIELRIKHLHFVLPASDDTSKAVNDFHLPPSPS